MKRKVEYKYNGRTYTAEYDEQMAIDLNQHVDSPINLQSFYSTEYAELEIMEQLEKIALEDDGKYNTD